MPWYFWFLMGMWLGLYMNSDRGYQDGLAAGKWTNKQLDRVGLLPAAWRHKEKGDEQ